MDWCLKDPVAGDIVSVDLEIGIRHFGVYVSDGEVIQFGLPPVGKLPSGDDVKVLASDIDAFRAGHFVEVAVLDRAERKRARSPEEVIAQARAKIGTGGYDIIYNNCEHFVQECLFGVKKSDSVEAVRKLWRTRFPENK